MKTWIHKVSLSCVTLEPELNALAEQGYEIFKIWKISFDAYEIVAFKETIIRDDVANGYDELGNPIKYGVS